MQNANDLMIQQKTLHNNKRIINHFKHTQRTDSNTYSFIDRTT